MENTQAAVVFGYSPEGMIEKMNATLSIFGKRAEDEGKKMSVRDVYVHTVKTGWFLWQKTVWLANITVEFTSVDAPTATQK